MDIISPALIRRKERMQLSMETGIPGLTVFIQGILSFFSPCVFPLVPLYISYLAGGTGRVDEEGNLQYRKKTVILHTIFFVLGIGGSFFILGLGFSALGQFFKEYRIWFARVSGIIMICLGVYQLGILGKSAILEKERRLSLPWDKWTMNPLTAWLLGFTFSFSWTPCVGPTLAGVLLMAGSSQMAATGFGLIGVYILGFVIPFLIVGLFAGKALDFLKMHGNIVRYTVKIGAALLILMGIMTLTGWMTGITGYLSSGTGGWKESENISQTDESVSKKDEQDVGESDDSQAESEKRTIAAPDFTLIDQYGNEHRLSDYKGKTVFLNFWATWCGPCRREMPAIQRLYEKYGENQQDLIVLGVVNPKTDVYTESSDVTEDEVKQFLKENGYRYPTVMDESGMVFAQYGISAFPTTFMIDADGNIYSYVSGALSEDMMDSFVEQTMESTETKE